MGKDGERKGKGKGGERREGKGNMDLTSIDKVPIVGKCQVGKSQPSYGRGGERKMHGRVIL